MNIIFKILRYLKRHNNLIRNTITVICIIAAVTSITVAADYKSLCEEQTQTATTARNENQVVEEENEKLGQLIDDHKSQIAEKDRVINELTAELEKKNKEAEAKKSTTVSTTKVVSDNKYPQAQTVWNYLKNAGLNDYVCAGIMGNIMAEVGGQTLDLSRWQVYSQETYYGICQWSGSRRTRLLNSFGSTLEDQARFLCVELFEVIPKDKSFYSLQDEKKAALYFAKNYERCSSRYYSVRQSNATKALKYFTGK